MKRDDYLFEVLKATDDRMAWTLAAIVFDGRQYSDGMEFMNTLDKITGRTVTVREFKESFGWLIDNGFVQRDDNRLVPALPNSEEN